jgi:hypothetical protein
MRLPQSLSYMKKQKEAKRSISGWFPHLQRVDPPQASCNTDLVVRTGSTYTTLRFYLLDLGEQKAILGYPWFVAVQPNINWKKGWIDHIQLPIILQTNNTKQAQFVPRQRNILRTKGASAYFIGRVLLHPQAILAKPIPGVPAEFARHRKVFSKEDSQRLPKHTVWDHAIELLPSAPNSLPRQLLPLKQDEIVEAHKFIAKHLKRGTIHELWSPYATNFFFVKKKDGKLCPVQDYQPVNKWTK